MGVGVGWGGPLIQYDWYLYIKGTFRDKHVYRKMQCKPEGRVQGDVSTS